MIKTNINHHKYTSIIRPIVVTLLFVYLLFQPSIFSPGEKEILTKFNNPSQNKPKNYANPSVMRIENKPTTNEAKELIHKTIEFFIKNGSVKTYNEINNKKGELTIKNQYLTVINSRGLQLAHGRNPSMVGVNFINFKDSQGKEIIKERLALAKTNSNFKQTALWPDLITKKIELKQIYCETYQEIIFCIEVEK